MSLTPTRYDHLSPDELARDPHEPLYQTSGLPPKAQGNLLSPLYERLSKPVVLALIGAAGLAGYYNLPQKMVERVDAIVHPHQVEKTKIVNNARSPLAGYNQVTNRVTFSQQEISNK